MINKFFKYFLIYCLIIYYKLNKFSVIDSVSYSSNILLHIGNSGFILQNTKLFDMLLFNVDFINDDNSNFFNVFKFSFKILFFL